jgi:hypothetical protein
MNDNLQCPKGLGPYRNLVPGPHFIFQVLGFFSNGWMDDNDLLDRPVAHLAFDDGFLDCLVVGLSRGIESLGWRLREDRYGVALGYKPGKYD